MYRSIWSPGPRMGRHAPLGWSTGGGAEGGSGEVLGRRGWGCGQCTIANSPGPVGLEAGGLPWADGAGSVCGAGGHRAEPRPGCPACQGSSGSGRGHGRQEDEATHALASTWTARPGAHAPALGPHLHVLGLRRAPGPQALQHLELPEVHVRAGGPAAPARLQLPGQLHGRARQPAGKKQGVSGGPPGSGGLSSGPCRGLVPDMAAGTGPLEARSEMVEVPGAERPILGSIELGKKMGGEVGWCGRRGGCLKQGQGHAPQGHLQERVGAHGVRMGHGGRLACGDRGFTRGSPERVGPAGLGRWWGCGSGPGRGETGFVLPGTEPRLSPPSPGNWTVRGN